MKTKKSKLIEYNKATIIEAASFLFQKDGVTKTTMDDIASRAECSKATVYVYFKSKEDIYYHIVLEYMIALRREVEKCVVQTRDYENAYYQLCNTLVNLEREYPMYFDYILGRISIDQNKFDELPVLQSIYDIGEEINDLVGEFLLRAKNDGFVDETIDSIQTTFVLWASICAIISLSSNKEDYIKKNMGLNRNVFLRNGFTMILRTFKKGAN